MAFIVRSAPVGSAYDEAVQLITRVQQRLQLPDPTPPLPTLDHVRTIVKSHIQRQTATQERLRDLVQSLSDRLPADWSNAVSQIHDEFPDGDLITGLHNVITRYQIRLTDAEQDAWHQLTSHDRPHAD